VASISAFIYTGQLLYVMELETVLGLGYHLVPNRLLEGLKFVLEFNTLVLDVSEGVFVRDARLE